MQERKKILEEIELVDNLKMLAQAYQEISVIKMQYIRNSVLKNRDFLSELSEVFYHVKQSYKKQIEAMMQKKKITDPKAFSTLTKNNKTVSVFISGNAKMYGDIIKKIFNVFVQQVKLSGTEVVIVGKVGKELFDERKIPTPYTYFEIPDADFRFDDLKPLIEYILPYQKVYVFYGKFINIISQDAQASSISGEQPFLPTAITNVELKYLFEPSLEKILNFFETQIFSFLLKQTMHESQLARYASRIKAMEEALINIDTKKNGLVSQAKRAKNSIQNKKQINIIAGISLWNK